MGVAFLRGRGFLKRALSLFQWAWLFLRGVVIIFSGRGSILRGRGQFVLYKQPKSFCHLQLYHDSLTSKVAAHQLLCKSFHNTVYKYALRLKNSH